MGKLKNYTKDFGRLLKQTFKVWSEREPFNNSIIIAYYTIFSLPGLLVIIINLAGYFFGKEAVTGQITGQIQGMIGGDTAGALQILTRCGNTVAQCVDRSAVNFNSVCDSQICPWSLLRKK